MNRAFVFDMDGVLVDSERYWGPFKEPFLERIFGEKVRKELGDVAGKGLEGVWDDAVKLGAKIDRNEFLKGYDEVATKVYDAAPLTDGVGKLADYLIAKGFKLALVTQSPQSWINRVIPHVPFKDKIDLILSLYERKDLKRKPAPDGFVACFQALGADPERSIVLEDSNIGIAAGKAAGAYVIGYRGNLQDDYKQTGADAYAHTMKEVEKIVITRL